MKYSLILLHWKRPIQQIIALANYYSQFKKIDEIIISQGHKEHIVVREEINHLLKRPEKIQLYDDSNLNEAYGLFLRFIRGASAKHENIIYVDDDLLVKKSAVDNGMKAYELLYPRIVGGEGRTCESYNTFDPEDGLRVYSIVRYGKCDIVLTKYLIMPKQVIDSFFILLPFFYDLLKKGKPWGNAEDILISLIATENFGEQNVAIGGETIYFSEIGSQEGICCWDGHSDFRSEVINFWRDNISTIKQILNK